MHQDHPSPSTFLFPCSHVPCRRFPASDWCSLGHLVPSFPASQSSLVFVFPFLPSSLSFSSSLPVESAGSTVQSELLTTSSSFLFPLPAGQFVRGFRSCAHRISSRIRMQKVKLGWAQPSQESSPL